MNKRKLDSSLWENVPFENFIIVGHSGIRQENLSISYFEKYGRVPSVDERKQIREYLSFFIGKGLIYVGEYSFDENGDEIGFIMEYPRTYGFAYFI